MVVDQVDIRDLDSVALLAQAHPDVDILINNAGGHFAQKSRDFTSTGWRAVIDLNLNGTWNMTQAFGNRMLDGAGSTICQIVMTVGHGMPGLAHGAAARARVVELCRTLAFEWGPCVRINAVAPGQVRTDAWLDTYAEGVGEGVGGAVASGAVRRLVARRHGLERRGHHLLMRGYRPVLNRMVARPRRVRFLGLHLDIPVGVFDPRLYFSTRTLAVALAAEDLRGRSVLDVGCGSGALALVAARAGAIVTAVDINPAAVAATVTNAAANALPVTALQSDLFDGLDPDADTRFDVVVVNPPYFAKDPANDTERAFFAGFDLGYFTGFFAGLGTHSAAAEGDSGGLMVLAEGCDLTIIADAARCHGWSLQELHRQRAWLGHQVLYRMVRGGARTERALDEEFDKAFDEDLGADTNAGGSADPASVGLAGSVASLSESLTLLVGDVGFDVVPDAAARYGPFWEAMSSQDFEPATVVALTTALQPGTRLLDVGAWIGPFTLLGAALGASVTAVEPDPVAFAALRNNVAANGDLAARITVRGVAAAARPGPVMLSSGPWGQGNGRSTVLSGPRGRPTDAVQVAGVDAAGLAVDTFDVVKVDIEGGEFTVIPAWSRALAVRRPLLLLSLHGPDPERARSRLGTVALRLGHSPRALRLLWALRQYSSVWRVASNRSPDRVKLGTIGRWALAFRLGEIELHFER